MCLLAFEADMEKAFAVQLSQDKVGGGRVRGPQQGAGLTAASCSGVLHLHGGGASEGQPLRSQVRDPVLLLSHLLSGLHPEVALHQELQQQDHQVSPHPGPGLRPPVGGPEPGLMVLTVSQVLSRVPRGLRVRHPFSLLGGEPRRQRPPHRRVQVWSQVSSEVM